MKLRSALSLIIVLVALAHARPAWPQTSQPPFRPPTRPQSTPPPRAQSTPPPPSQSIVVQSVSVYNSPSVGASQGHSVLGSIFSGNGFSGIEPNLVVCARPQGTSADKRICTEICPPSHECLNQPFPQAVVPAPDNPFLPWTSLTRTRPRSLTRTPLRGGSSLPSIKTPPPAPPATIARSTFLTQRPTGKVQP